MTVDRRMAGPVLWAARLVVALLSLCALVWALRELESSSAGLVVTPQRVGSAPAIVFRAVDAKPGAPVVLIAHGFAGSQQLMQPFAHTLARNGFTAITFDFPGHGRHHAPMSGGLADQDLSHKTLLIAMDLMGDFARSLSTDGRYAVLGHSMASDIVVRHAQARPEVQAAVGVSMFAPSITAQTPPDSPRNLLAIAGALEPGMMATEALRIAGRTGGADSVMEKTYGSFIAGTARRAVLAPGAEHIGVLYNSVTQAESLAWLNAAFGRSTPAEAFVDARGPALGLLLAGVLGLAWPLSALLPRLAQAHGGSPASPMRWASWPGPWLLVVAPAVLTPLVLWKLPTEVLPLLLGDYLVLHFALYGVLTFLGLLITRHRWPSVMPGRQAAFLGVLLLATAWAMLAVGVPMDRYVFNVWPEPLRLPLVLALCAGTLPWFLADEWLTRSPDAPRAAYLVTKACFLLSLVGAIALNPQRLFFLAILVPAILLLFIVYGLFSRWIFRATGHPALAAVAHALAFGAFIAVTFPLVA
jgi:dienelactone hydrolase